MVTKIKNLRQAMAMSSNYEQDPDATTGTTFGITAGKYQKDGASGTNTATTHNLTSGDGLYSIYVDINEVTPTVKSELGAPTSGRYVPLYEVTVSGSSIASVNDVRSWTSASVGEAGGTGGTPGNTAFDAVVDALAPVIDLKFAETTTAAGIPNEGTGGATYDGSWKTAGNIRVNLVGGDVGSSRAAAQIGSVNSACEIKDIVSPGIASDTEGAILMIFKTSDASSNFFDFGEPSGNYLRGTYSGTFFRYTSNVGGNNFSLDAPGSLPWDNEWNMVIINQPADGGGPRIYWNGADATSQGNSSMSGAEADDWLADMASDLEDIAVNGYWYYAANQVFSGFEGYTDRFCYFDSALTAAQIGDLYDAYVGGADFDFDQQMTDLSLHVDYVLDSTASIVDAAGNFPTLTANGATATLVDAGGVANTQTQALDFGNSTGDHYMLQDFALTPWSGKGSGTALAFFKSEDSHNSIQTIFKVGNFGSTGAGGLSNPGFRINMGTSGYLECQCYTSSSAVGWTLSGTAFDFEDDSWHMVAIVQDGISPVLYVDGKVYDDTPTGSNPDYWLGDLATYMSTSTDNAVSIGGQSYSAGGTSDAYLWNDDGAIERVAFTDTVMTQAEVQDLWRAWRGTKTA